MKYFLLVLVFICAKQVCAQNLVISDVDDTIKLADVPSYTGVIDYAVDENSHFTGLNYLYDLIQQDKSASFYYVSKAPEWLMKTIHMNFLARNGFPQGTYIGRTSYSAAEHKLLTIREILNRIKPQRVLLIGDNGEQDAAVYAKIANEFSRKGIEFTQYIHIVYSVKELGSSMIRLTSDQIGFVTAVELGQDLMTKNWLSQSSQAWTLKNILPQILNETPGGEESDLAFPYFMDCREIIWRWNIPGLNEKIQHVCH